MKKLFFILVLILQTLAFGYEITDMVERKIALDTNITRAFGASPPMSAMLYMLANKKW